MTHLQKIHQSGSAGPLLPEQCAAGLLVKADLALKQQPRRPDSRSPYEVTMAEQTAIRILVHHYGWRVTEPGVLRRVPAPRAGTAEDAPLITVPGVEVAAPRVIDRQRPRPLSPAGRKAG